MLRTTSEQEVERILIWLVASSYKPPPSETEKLVMCIDMCSLSFSLSCSLSLLEDDCHTDWVSCVRFSPNTQNLVIVSCDWDKLVKVTPIHLRDHVLHLLLSKEVYYVSVSLPFTVNILLLSVFSRINPGFFLSKPPPLSHSEVSLS